MVFNKKVIIKDDLLSEMNREPLEKVAHHLVAADFIVLIALLSEEG
jgi:hypothetical protein